MKKLLVMAALLAAVASPAAAQKEEAIGSGKAAVFHLTPYVGYVLWGDHFEGPNFDYTNNNSASFGVQAALDMSPNLALFANGMYSKTQFEFEDNSGTGFAASGDVGIWFYDAGIEFKLPFGGGETTFTPFAQAGLGAVKFSADADDFSSSGATNIAYNAGLGFDMQIGGMGLRLMAKDYISSLKWDELNDAGDFDAPISHNWALTAGLKFSF